MAVVEVGRLTRWGWIDCSRFKMRSSRLGTSMVRRAKKIGELLSQLIFKLFEFFPASVGFSQ